MKWNDNSPAIRFVFEKTCGIKQTIFVLFLFIVFQRIRIKKKWSVKKYANQS